MASPLQKRKETLKSDDLSKQLLLHCHYLLWVFGTVTKHLKKIGIQAETVKLVSAEQNWIPTDICRTKEKALRFPFFGLSKSNSAVLLLCLQNISLSQRTEVLFAVENLLLKQQIQHLYYHLTQKKRKKMYTFNFINLICINLLSFIS